MALDQIQKRPPVPGLHNGKVSVQRLHLSSSLLMQLYSYARQQPEQEICGLLSGTHNQVKHLFPINNDADDKAHYFAMAPREQIAAMRQMRELGERLLAIYHSHPRGPAQPSSTDVAQHEYPGVYTLILSPQTKGIWQLRAYLIQHNACQEISVHS